MNNVVDKWRNRGQASGRIPKNMFEMFDKAADFGIHWKEFRDSMFRGDFDKDKSISPDELMWMIKRNEHIICRPFE